MNEKINFKERLLYKLTSSRVIMEVFMFTIITILRMTSHLDQENYTQMINWMLVAFFGSKAVEHGTKK